MKPRLPYICCLFVCLSVSSVCAGILNGNFEIFEPNENPPVNLPVDWECENHVVVDSNLVPVADNRGGKNWKIDYVTGLQPFDGSYFVILNSGGLSPGVKSKISQTVEFFPGQKFSGAYFFGTYDYLGWDDQAWFILEAVDSNNSNIIIVDISVGDVGDYSSTEGWETFEHIFSAEEAGVYNISISVENTGDNQLASFFAVDGLEVCTIPLYGDVNSDCKVDLVDFDMLSQDWMLFDPCSVSHPSDPNYWRQYETNFDGIEPVDEGDLSLMVEYWLFAQ